MSEREYNVIPETKPFPLEGVFPARAYLPLHLTALLYAHDELGIKETSENWGPRVKEYLAAAGIKVPAPWCGAFVYWTAQKACKVKGVANPLKDIPLKAYVQSYYQYAKAQNKLVPFKEAAIGDIFMIYYPSLKRYGHMGFVYDIDYDKQTIGTLEGNSNSTGSREGNEVVTKTRKWGPNIVFFRYC